MADATTPNLGLVLPEVAGSLDSWGDKANANWTAIDNAVGTLAPITGFTQAAASMGNPISHAAATTEQMFGAAVLFTPTVGTRASITWSGGLYVGILNLRYGTGAPPALGAPPAGTIISTVSFAGGPTGNTTPCSANCLLTGLTIGTTYWLDVSLAPLSGTTGVSSLNTLVAVEIIG